MQRLVAFKLVILNGRCYLHVQVKQLLSTEMKIDFKCLELDTMGGECAVCLVFYPQMKIGFLPVAIILLIVIGHWPGSPILKLLTLFLLSIHCFRA